MKFYTLDNLINLVLGIIASILASFLISLYQGVPIVLIILLCFTLLLTVSNYITLRTKIVTLRSIGIRDWESRPTKMTNTKSCILKSQTKLRFFGITGNKWLKEKDELKKMFARHFSNGGCAEFLLLNPNSEACASLQKVKSGIEILNFKADIISNAKDILEYAEKYDYNVKIKFYSNKARFRVTIIDDDEIIVGLYSYTSLKGNEETPQLILKNQHENWSFYYGFNAYFQNAWDNADDASDILDY